jgi:two-component system phosphate regulon sensor histidine kinase PhoR
MASDPQPSRGKNGWLAAFLILFVAFLTMIVATAIGVGQSMQRSWQESMRDTITRNLSEKTRMFANRVETDRTRKIANITSEEGHNAGARATVIDVNGKVLADSEVPVASLEDEGRRPEFATALRGQTGSETRRRGTFGTAVLYVAVPVSGGAVRLAYPLADISIASGRARRTMILGSVIAAFAGLAISALAAQTLSRKKGA